MNYIEKLYGIISLEDEIEGKMIVESARDEGLKNFEISSGVRMLLKMGAVEAIGNGASITSKSYKALPGEFNFDVEIETPKAKSTSKFGTTKQVNSKGEEYFYQRKEVDGPELEYDKNLAEQLVKFKVSIKEIRTDIDGIGRYSFKIGDDFYRYDSKRGQAIMKELKPLVQRLVEQEQELKNEFGTDDGE